MFHLSNAVEAVAFPPEEEKNFILFKTITSHFPVDIWNKQSFYGATEEPLWYIGNVIYYKWIWNNSQWKTKTIHYDKIVHLNDTC